MFVFFLKSHISLLSGRCVYDAFMFCIACVHGVRLIKYLLSVFTYVTESYDLL